MALPLLSLAQRQVSGTITNDRGEPLSAVSVLEKGTNNGVTTNSKGHFSIAVSGASPVLVITYSGMEAKEITVGTSSVFNISLSENGTMSEVVVTALGITRKDRSIGYATQQV